MLRQAKLKDQPSAIDGELAAEFEPSGGETQALPDVAAAAEVLPAAVANAKVRVFNPAIGRLE